MNYLKLSSCLFIILFMSISVNAQFSIYTQQRTRFEMRDGYKKLANINQDAAFRIHSANDAGAANSYNFV